MHLQRSLVVLLAAIGLAVGTGLAGSPALSAEEPSSQIRVATFNVDATPPLGSPVAYAAELRAAAGDASQIQDNRHC